MKYKPRKASRKTRALLGLITFTIAALGVAYGLQVNAQSPAHAQIMAMQTATGQYVTPTALRRCGAAVPESGAARVPELHRRRGRAFAAQPGRQDAGDPHRRPELARQAGRHHRRRRTRPSSSSCTT